MNFHRKYSCIILHNVQEKMERKITGIFLGFYEKGKSFSQPCWGLFTLK